MNKGKIKHIYKYTIIFIFCSKFFNIYNIYVFLGYSSIREFYIGLILNFLSFLYNLYFNDFRYLSSLSS